MIDYRLGKICQESQKCSERPTLPGQLARRVQLWHQLLKGETCQHHKGDHCTTQLPPDIISISTGLELSLQA